MQYFSGKYKYCLPKCYFIPKRQAQKKVTGNIHLRGHIKSDSTTNAIQ